MNVEQWMDLGRQLIEAPTAQARARMVVHQIPSSAISSLGLAPMPSGTLRIGGALAVFAVGAAAGAGAILFFGPAGDDLRRSIASRFARAKTDAPLVENAATGGAEGKHDDARPETRSPGPTASKASSTDGKNLDGADRLGHASRLHPSSDS